MEIRVVPLSLRMVLSTAFSLGTARLVLCRTCAADLEREEAIERGWIVSVFGLLDTGLSIGEEESTGDEVEECIYGMFRSLRFHANQVQLEVLQSLEDFVRDGRKKKVCDTWTGEKCLLRASECNHTLNDIVLAVDLQIWRNTKSFGVNRHI